MEKIFFAIGYEKVEKRIRELLDTQGFIYEVVYAAVHKESVISEIPLKKPSILILSEALQGKINVFELAFNIKRSFPEIRIIFLAAAGKEEDANIANLVAYGIYDILSGAQIQVPDIVNLIIKPNNFQDVAHLLPRKGGLFDLNSFDGISNSLGESKDALTSKSETVININSPDKIKEISVPSNENGEIPIEEISIDGLNDDEKQKENKSKNGIKFPIGIPFPIKFPQKNKEEISQADIPIQSTPIPNPYQSVNPVQEQYPPQNPWPPQNSGVPQNPQFQPHLPPVDNGYSGYPGYYPPQNGYPPNGNMDGFHQIQSPNRGNYNTIDLGNNRIVSSKQRLITFYSPKGGIGTTVVALNCAMEAAKRANQRVLLIEFNVEFSSLAYWFDLPNNGYGLDDAILGIGTDYNSINSAIITKEKMLKSDTSYIDGIKRIPEGLNFLVFSDMFYKKSNKPIISASNLEKVITYCLYTLNYDEVYLDVSAGTNREIIDSSLISSGKNVILMSQDTAIINSVAMFFNELSLRGLKFDIGLQQHERNDPAISYKNIYVINKYGTSSFTEKKIKEWTRCRNLCCIPENGGEINELLNAGYIPLSASKGKQFKDSFNHLVNLIEK